ncbi:hypothetical protein D1BOALGB6SA_1328 [Olavius sp. associated proteobacterium Delta 1]|nr:hypothetical protein D1BOALGB6SA_1328 [Olavius sp. associated proteobacterium Delta 1]
MYLVEIEQITVETQKGRLKKSITKRFERSWPTACLLIQ